MGLEHGSVFGAMRRARISFWTGSEVNSDQFLDRPEEHGSDFGTDEKSTDQIFGLMR